MVPCLNRSGFRDGRGNHEKFKKLFLLDNCPKIGNVCKLNLVGLAPSCRYTLDSLSLKGACGVLIVGGF
jgi:hypothetical protein